ncbi:hypothetical protein FHW58_002085 [Duganella sp. 1224]|uniref:hypothetical protein n=1 Tax=Duganella sp. 1224 TaxID=2587052 RepID=UPI0018358F71|nr:hypothetical protein [Duganella sp. 1224]NYE60933.1 hypothetical protein [Duganella sp. 1224]
MEHPDHPIGNMHLPSRVFMALTGHVGEGYYGPQSEAALCALIRQWVATTPPAHSPSNGMDEEAGGPNASAIDQPPVAASSAASPPVVDVSRGYQWKDLFLPNGTELRVIYGGRSLYATVEDEQIVGDNGPTTPSRLANRQGCGTRNAWQAVWLRMPGRARWQRAADCRRQAAIPFS